MKKALIIIDIQQDYFPGGKMELEASEDAASAAALLLAQFRKRNQPIYHVQHVNVRPTATFFLPGTPGVEIHPSVLPAGEPIITKHFPNSFRETVLLEKLREDNVDSLVICGMMSHMCIDATVRAAFDLGFTCTVIHNACATRSLSFNGLIVPAKQVHGAYMAALGSVYAQVKGVEEALEDWGPCTSGAY